MSAMLTRTAGAHAAPRAPHQSEPLPPKSLCGRADGAQSKLLNLNPPGRPALLYVSVLRIRTAARAYMAAARPPRRTEHLQPKLHPPASARRRRTARTSKPAPPATPDARTQSCAAPPRTHPHLRAPPPNAHSESRAQNGTIVTARTSSVRTYLSPCPTDQLGIEVKKRVRMARLPLAARPRGSRMRVSERSTGRAQSGRVREKYVAAAIGAQLTQWRARRSEAHRMAANGLNRPLPNRARHSALDARGRRERVARKKNETRPGARSRRRRKRAKLRAAAPAATIIKTHRNRALPPLYHPLRVQRARSRPQIRPRSRPPPSRHSEKRPRGGRRKRPPPRIPGCDWRPPPRRRPHKISWQGAKKRGSNNNPIPKLTRGASEDGAERARGLCRCVARRAFFAAKNRAVLRFFLMAI